MTTAVQWNKETSW